MGVKSENFLCSTYMLITMAELHNETVVYVTTLLVRVKEEIEQSQSARLAVGFLEKDARRFMEELDRIKVTIGAEKPEDYPETHPKRYSGILETPVE